MELFTAGRKLLDISGLKDFREKASRSGSQVLLMDCYFDVRWNTIHKHLLVNTKCYLLQSQELNCGSLFRAIEQHLTILGAFVE